MIELLSHWLIRNRENTGDPAVRLAYGRLCGLVGIGLNLLLFGGKLFAGTVSGSVAVTADAFNNLSDAGSSVVTLLGFQLAGKKPDPQHPFGHGRIEYISGLVVSGLILLMGVELGKSSVEKILHPEAVDFSLLAVGILVASIAVKLYMYLYNRRISRRISSAAMEATATAPKPQPKKVARSKSVEPKPSRDEMTFAQRMVTSKEPTGENEIPGMAPAQKIIIVLALIAFVIFMGYTILTSMGLL